MKRMKFMIMALLAICGVCSLMACGSDDDENKETTPEKEVTLTLGATTINSYQPEGTIVLPITVSDANLVVSKSDFGVSLGSIYGESDIPSINLKGITLEVSSVEKGSAAGEWNLILNMDMNKLTSATADVVVYYKDKQFGQFTLQAQRAHKLDRQRITSTEDEDLSILTVTVALDDVLKEENVTLDNNRCAFYLVNSVGDFVYALDDSSSPALGWVGTQGNNIQFGSFDQFSTGNTYYLIVRVQRSSDASEGYVWIEIPFVIVG